jgi:2-oxoglutarate ferredoxin oxidoreductase subunit alpha
MGCKISLLILKTLYPVPQNLIRQAIDGKKEIVVVEMNNGQYVREIERLAGSVPVRFYGQMNGELISPEKIVKEVTA